MDNYTIIMAALALLGLGLLFYRSAFGQADDGRVQDITTDELKAAMQSNPDIVLVDVRTPQEYKGGHIKGALLINYFSPDFKQKIKELEKDKPVYLYCRSGNRSSKAARYLAQQGHEGPLYNLAGGYMAWKK